MHYYQRNIGDYRRKTGHLSLLEHGIYSLLLDTYYLTEQPLSADRRELARLHMIRTTEELVALDNVLCDFFTQTPDGFVQPRAEQELVKIYGKSEKARLSAKARWQKDANAMLDGCSSDANASENHANASKSHAFGMLPNTHNPIPNTQEIPAPEGTDPPKGGKGKQITLITYLKQRKVENKKPFDDDSAVIQYGQNAGIPDDFIGLAWREFKYQHTEGDRKGKKYTSWPSAFLNCLKGNWYRLWFTDGAEYKLTTAGQQAQLVARNSKQ